MAYYTITAENLSLNSATAIADRVEEMGILISADLFYQFELIVDTFAEEVTELVKLIHSLNGGAYCYAEEVTEESIEEYL